MKLNNYEEMVGTLVDYKHKKNKTSLKFEIHKTLEIPSHAISNEELEECKYKRIGIINADGSYKLRKIRMPIDDFKDKNCPSCHKYNQCSQDGEEMVYCLIGKINEMKKS